MAKIGWARLQATPDRGTSPPAQSDIAVVLRRPSATAATPGAAPQLISLGPAEEHSSVAREPGVSGLEFSQLAAALPSVSRTECCSSPASSVRSHAASLRWPTVSLSRCLAAPSSTSWSSTATDDWTSPWCSAGSTRRRCTPSAVERSYRPRMFDVLALVLADGDLRACPYCAVLNRFGSGPVDVLGFSNGGNVAMRSVASPVG
jgi:hypothetical protein